MRFFSPKYSPFLRVRMKLGSACTVALCVTSTYQKKFSSELKLSKKIVNGTTEDKLRVAKEWLLPQLTIELNPWCTPMTQNFVTLIYSITEKEETFH